MDFPKGKAKLTVDTSASGLYISQALAEANGFQHAEGAPPNTVEVDNLQIGPLQFRNCMVGVSDTPFSDGVEGFIGTDVFAPYLITLNFPEAKLEVEPLPRLPGEQKSALPGDRYFAPDLRGYTPVYHKNQYLLVPVMLNKKDRRLFVLDTGIRLTTMTSEVAHSISNTRVNFTNPVRTVSGATLQIYRDSFDLQFANLSLDRQGHILEFDPSAIDQNAGMEVAGMLGFDILHSLVMHIDYRDGLVKFDSPASGPARTTVLSSQTAAPSPSSSEAYNSGCTSVCEPKHRSSPQLHDPGRHHRLAGLRAPQGRPADQCQSSPRLDSTELHSYRGSYPLRARTGSYRFQERLRTRPRL